MSPSPKVKKTYGRLTVISSAGLDRDKRWLWKCQCSCGNFINILGIVLRSEYVNDCGCVEKELEELKEINLQLTDVLSKERSSMLARLLNLMGMKDG